MPGNAAYKRFHVIKMLRVKCVFNTIHPTRVPNHRKAFFIKIRG
jgi:hypothetical protein